MTKINLKTLNLHESISVDKSTSVLKVHGGFVYKYIHKEEGKTIAISTIYVPFTDVLKMPSGKYSVI